MRWTLLILLILICGCTTERKVAIWLEKNPDSEIWEQWKTSDTIVEIKIDTVYRTDSFWTQLPPERITDSFLIEVPCPDVLINVGPDTIETSYARVVYGIRNNEFYIDLENKTDPWKTRYDSAIAEIHIKDKEIIHLTLTKEIKLPVPWFYKAAAWGWVGAIFIAGLIFILLQILKKIKR